MDIDIGVEQVFRADELYNLIKHGRLIPPCYPCIDSDAGEKK
jgi:hypothetical protein